MRGRSRIVGECDAIVIAETATRLAFGTLVSTVGRTSFALGSGLAMRNGFVDVFGVAARTTSTDSSALKLKAPARPASQKSASRYNMMSHIRARISTAS